MGRWIKAVDVSDGCVLCDGEGAISWVRQEDVVQMAVRLLSPGLLDAFGLREQKDALIGTPIRKGISGGQKRRAGVASQLITCPRILFLDEPTSGLDSKAGWEVVKYLKGVARRNNVSLPSLYVLTCSRYLAPG